MGIFLSSSDSICNWCEKDPCECGKFRSDVQNIAQEYTITEPKVTIGDMVFSEEAVFVVRSISKGLAVVVSLCNDNYIVEKELVEPYSLLKSSLDVK